MVDNNQEKSGDMISGLIAAEEEDALARCGATHFEDRLRSKLARGLAEQPRPSAFRFSLRPVWISVLGLIVLASAALIFLRSRPQASRSAATVENALRHLPGILALEEDKPGSLDATSLPDSPFDQSIAMVLSTRLKPGGTLPAGDRRPDVPIFDPMKKPLDLQELYDLLIMNKSVERVLTLVSSKPKEG